MGAEMEKKRYKAKVSIVMPVYNAMPFLAQAIESIISQTLEEIEIICVDDCSNDTSLELIEKYKECDNRIKVVRSEKNCGAGRARNVGMELASGEYLMFLDSDDFFSLDMLKDMYDEAVRKKADIVFCDINVVDLCGNTKYEKRVPRWFCDKCITDGVVNENATMFLPNIVGGVVWKNMYRREFIDSNGFKFQEVYNCDDIYFSAVTTMEAKKIIYMGSSKSPYVYYRTGNKQSQVAKVKDIFACYQAGKSIFDYVNGFKRSEYYRGAFAFFVYNMWTWLDAMTDEQQAFFARRMREGGLSELGIKDWFETDNISLNKWNQLSSLFENEHNDRTIADCIGKMIYDVPNLFSGLKYGFKNIYLWGYGKTGQFFYEMCEKYKLELKGIVDKSDSVAGISVGKYKIFKPSDIDLKTADVILVTNYKYVESINREIAEMGLDIPIFDVMSYCRFNVTYEDCLLC